MTFVNHTAGGFAIGWVIGRLINLYFPALELTLPIAIFCGLLGAFPDVGGWVFWKLFPSRWTQWELYGYCHPPYDPVSGHGKYDRFFKWLPPWGFHTWVVDSIVHPTGPKFIFPKFKMEWTDVIWVRIPLSYGKNVVQLTKWDVLYALLELSLYLIYIAICLCI